MPEGTDERVDARLGCGSVRRERAFCVIVTVEGPGSRIRNAGQRPECEVTREERRRFSAVNLRPVG